MKYNISPIPSWINIKGFENRYLISDCGEILSIINKSNYKKLKQSIDRNGYSSVVLYDSNGVRHFKLVHRLVAECFIENIDNKPEVNHIDEDKSNNKSSNLQWCTRIENRNHGTFTNRQSIKMINGKLSKKVYQYDINNNLIKIWISQAEAGRNGFQQELISMCIRGKRKTHKGFIWKVKN